MQRITGSPFIDGNPATNTKGTILAAAWLNAVQEELAGTIEGLGGVLNPANNGQLLAQLLAKFYLKTTGEAFGGIKSVAGAGTIDATYAGQLTVLSGTTYALALPSAATYPAGSTLTFCSSASGVVTLNRAGTDTVSMNNTTSVTSITLGSGDTLTLVSNGVGIWEAVAGSVQQGYSMMRHSITPASRVENTNYTNTTGKVMTVTVRFSHTIAFHAYCSAGGNVVAGDYRDATSASYAHRFSFNVLPGETYSWAHNSTVGSTPTLQYWEETY